MHYLVIYIRWSHERGRVLTGRGGACVAYLTCIHAIVIELEIIDI